MAGRNLLYLLGIGLLLSSVSCTQRKSAPVEEAVFSGSASCIECHENFYKLWSPSHHGKAMEPINLKYIQDENLPESEEFSLEGKIYRVAFEDSSMFMIEKDGDATKKYEVVWALGGKNVSYFLTMLEKGKLQTIPLAYDVNRKIWYNNPESAVRHFPDGSMPADEALPWMDRMYNFNSSCYSCHVSQLNTNFDLSTDSYNSTWNEPGINCETCHGPSSEHVRIFRNAKEGEEFEDIGLIVTKTFTQQQHNSSCAPCHAKMQPITPSYMPGDRYFDNYDLTTLENTDFYPDGRDLGENYTFTGWNMNECVANSKLHCVTCHTSSGRNRFADNPNQACASCHIENAANVATHSGHKVGSEGAVCVNCHMPKSEFGRMIRSDHSFRPPMPEGTIRFESPNACNMCHTEKSAEWANNVVKQRKNSNYQDETMAWAQLIKEARSSEWKNLDKMLAHVNAGKLNEVVLTSFIRTLANCYEDKKWETIIKALNYDSPLVRAAAASGLTGQVTEEAKNALVIACKDEYRLVRISAAASLAAFAPNQFSVADAPVVTKATEEYMNSVVTRPDDWSSHYNLGIFHQNRGDAQKALESYEVAARLYPESLMPLINSSVLYSYIGNTAKAEENLKLAIQFDPDNEAANLNLGLLLAEQGKLVEAEQALKAALQANPEQPVAAYNLSVITAQRSIQEAVSYAKIAADAAPEEPKYAYTLAYYQVENNQKKEAIKTLTGILTNHPQYLTATSFLADLYMKDGKKQQAILLYQQALKVEGISVQDKQGIQQAILSIQQSL
ncbi:MAG: ammonia-forming cytochrome c nitrite reductase subunit c552 [Bacteroidetes bacterium]|nr:ammonia-forming cytochrome c nitrite reductase subunit c552 [Bacteroidota bacterium]